MTRCPTCKYQMYESPFLPAHVCPPAWLVWDEGSTVADGYTVYAPDATAAAETYLEDEHRGSGVYEQEQRVVFVRLASAPEDEAPIRLRVRMELMPSYAAWPEPAKERTHGQ